MQDRNKRIGGSDASVIMGHNEFCTINDLWRRKVYGHDNTVDNGHIRRGITMEPIVEDYIKTNLDPTMNNPENFALFDKQPEHSYQISVEHPDYSFIGGHPDGIGDKCIWEIKCPTMRKLELIYTDGLPQMWIDQVYHYMMCTGRRWGVIAIWDYNAWEPKIYRLKENPEYQEKMLARYLMFWEELNKGWDLIEETGALSIREPEFEDFESGTQIATISDSVLDQVLVDLEVAKSKKYDGDADYKKLRSEVLTQFKHKVPLYGNHRFFTDQHQVSISHIDRKTYAFYRITSRPREENGRKTEKE